MNKNLMGLLISLEMKTGLVSKALELRNSAIEYVREHDDTHVSLPLKLSDKAVSRLATKLSIRLDVAKKLYEDSLAQLVEVSHVE